ncbi:MAG: ABC transporter ATP-binding protein [Syntrophales bacterium]|jgi:peptide/nickel transport system ATP-binding protein/oligopeptide transport system ATP-binding protein|nr:ABC transporter ATP-binding protein [Syntrophales bacterium]
MSDVSTVLDIQDLKTVFHTDRGDVRAVDGVSLNIAEGRTLGVVGESGCGKTVLALSVMRLVPIPPGEILSGRILLDGIDLLQLNRTEIQDIRGKKISMIFQEPMTSLNPVIRVGEQIAEIVRLHENMSHREALAYAVEMLRMVGIDAPGKRVRDYPHQMSGGMRQRIMIAMALSCKPRLMIADEPTTALDVTVQAQILELMNDLKAKINTSILFITHDLGIIAHFAQTVAIMYAGKIVEQAPVDHFFSAPLHPYSLGLIEAIPTVTGQWDPKKRLRMIPGHVPDIADRITGCAFQDRCGYVMPICREEEPEWIGKRPDHFVRCWKWI